jgi:hypothetical protein
VRLRTAALLQVVPPAGSEQQTHKRGRHGEFRGEGLRTWRTVMPRLMFTCPSTGEPFASGIQTDEKSLALVAQLPVTLECPLCGKSHRMIAKSGCFEEVLSGPPAPSPKHRRAQLPRG